jgi:hypothetical protein
MRFVVRAAAVVVGAIVGVLVARVFLLNTIEQLALALLMDGALGARAIDPFSFLTSPVGLKLEVGALLGVGGAALASERWIVPRLQPIAAAPPETDVTSTTNRRPLVVALVAMLVIAAVALGLALGGVRL